MNIFFKGIYNNWVYVPQTTAYNLYVSNGGVMLDVDGRESTCLWRAPDNEKIIEWNAEHGCDKNANDYAHIIMADIMRHIFIRCDLCVDVQNTWCIDVGACGVNVYTPPEALEKKIFAKEGE